jgi:hypothetical protein
MLPRAWQTRINVPFGKTDNARRTIPLTPRASTLIEMRCSAARTEEIRYKHPAPRPLPASLDPVIVDQVIFVY